MTDDEIARRLREQGMASAPPDLLERVMRTVRSEPRLPVPRRVWRRPLLVWAAAACLAAGGFAVAAATLGGGPSPSHQSAERSAAAVEPPAPGPGTYAFSGASQAQAVLGVAVWSRRRPVGGGVYRLDVSRSEYGRLRQRISAFRTVTSGQSLEGASKASIRVVIRVRGR
ncbi:MAG TPA: hypothetical protein VMU66_00800 [Gaiellales bacterium]|nr:hypothetical protein [Gaiellales bacterium]